MSRADGTPRIGDPVYYYSYGTPGGEYTSQPRAAIVTEVADSVEGWSRKLSLAVINPSGTFFNKDVPYSEEPKPGHWSWPPESGE